VYLPPYSPDLNLIEEFYAELKDFIKRTGNPLRKTLIKISILFLSDVLML
jgi:transposase